MEIGTVPAWVRNYAVLILFVVLQFGYWSQTRDIKPDLGVVPDVPGKAYIHAMTFGDDEFYFRMLAFTIQTAGDTFGRFTALRYYDMNKLYYWFGLLDELDRKSDMVPAMASYYFAQTQNTADVRYVTDYLYEHSVHDVAHKWWWLIQGIYLSMHKLHDMDMALKMAKPLRNDDVPVWAQEMTAVVYEKRGEMTDAYNIIESIRQHAKNIPDAELKYMRYFVEERLKKLEETGKPSKFGPPPDAIGRAPAHPQ